MNRKTITGIITGKFNKWVATIDDEKVVELVEKNTIITGGCIASMLMGEQANDFDVYFSNQETSLAVANYYANKYKDADDTQLVVTTENVDNVRIVVGGDMNRVASVFASSDTEDGSIQDGAEPEEDEKVKLSPYSPIFISPNAITLLDKIQIILRFAGTPEEIHNNFDFIHCMNYWESDTGKLTLSTEAMESILAKQLTYVGSLYPVASLIRTRKFIRRGWKINAGQFLKMALQISDLDLTDIAVLQDQLTGVDVAYFFHIIEAIQEKDEQTITTAYITEIIDRMF